MIRYNSNKNLSGILFVFFFSLFKKFKNLESLLFESSLLVITCFEIFSNFFLCSPLRNSSLSTHVTINAEDFNQHQSYAQECNKKRKKDVPKFRTATLECFLSELVGAQLGILFDSSKVSRYSGKWCFSFITFSKCLHGHSANIYKAFVLRSIFSGEIVIKFLRFFFSFA